jgi:hypothetical protein
VSQKNLKALTKRNLNVNYINRKVFYLLHDPLIYINAYTKITKSRRVLAKRYNDDNTTELFGITRAKKIAEQIKKEIYKIEPVKRT